MSWDPIVRDGKREYEPEVWDLPESAYEFGVNRVYDANEAKAELKYQFEKRGTPVYGKIEPILSKLPSAPRMSNVEMYIFSLNQYLENLKQLQYQAAWDRLYEIECKKAEAREARRAELERERERRWEEYEKEQEAARIRKEEEKLRKRQERHEALIRKKMLRASEIINENMEQYNQRINVLTLPPYYMYDNSDKITIGELNLIMPFIDMIEGADTCIADANNAFDRLEDTLFYPFILSEEMNNISTRFMTFVNAINEQLKPLPRYYNRTQFSAIYSYVHNLEKNLRRGRTIKKTPVDYMFDYIIKMYIVAYKTNDFSYVQYRFGLSKHDIEWLNCYFTTVNYRDHKAYVGSFNSNIVKYYNDYGYDSSGTFMEIFNLANINTIINHFAEQIPASAFNMVYAWHPSYVAESNTTHWFGIIMRVYQILFDQILARSTPIYVKALDDVYEYMLTEYSRARSANLDRCMPIRNQWYYTQVIADYIGIPSAKILGGFMYLYASLEKYRNEFK